MRPDDPYFRASVDLISARIKIENMLADLKDHGLEPSMSMLGACISDLTAAMAKTHVARLSDRKYLVKPACERGCGYAAEHHVCQLDECAL